MKNKTILLITVGLLLFVSLSCILSEISWSITINKSDSLRKLVGLPSVAVGNLNPASRNPGLEIMCTSLYDSPGGYCYYFTTGVPISNITIFANITMDGTK
jgi:hypothetical protein